MRAAPHITRGLALVLALAAALGSVSATAGETVSLEDGRLLASYESWLARVRHERAPGHAVYRAAADAAYLAHWEDVLARNVDVLRGRDRIARDTLEDYRRVYDPALEKLIRYLELRRGLQRILDAPDLPRRFFPHAYRVVEEQGHNPWTWAERVAAESRPPPLELETASLAIEPPAFDPDADYWVDERGEMRFLVRNEGEEDAESLTLHLTLRPVLLDSLRGPGARCDASSGACRLDALAAGAEQGLEASLSLDGERLALSPAGDHRREVLIMLDVESTDPPGAAAYEASFHVRDCAAAWRAALERIRSRELPILQATRREALAPNAALPGQPIHPAPTGSRIDGVAEVAAEATRNRGPDAYLLDESRAWGELDVLRRETEELVPDLLAPRTARRMCRSPEARLGAIRARLDELRRRARHARARATYAEEEAGLRAERLVEELALVRPETGQTLVLSDTENEVLKTAIRKSEVFFPNLAVRQLGNRMGGASGAIVTGGSKAVGVAGLGKSTYDVAVALKELIDLWGLRSVADEALAWREAAAYLDGVAGRYERLADAHETHLDRIASHHARSCTCIDPF